MIGHHLLWVSLIFIWNDLCTVSGSEKKDKTCSVEELGVCESSETCQQIHVGLPAGFCKCLEDYYRSSLSGLCVPNSQDSSTDFSNNVSASAIAVGLLVPVIAILIIGGLVLAARRYRWVHRFRDQAHQLTVRNYDTVLVANDDDGPIG